MISGTNTFSLIESKVFPTNPDLPNDDDLGNDDEDNTPYSFYGYDGPSEPINPGLAPGNNSYAYMKADHNFEEYVRMSFTPLSGSGNQLYGSRCSDKVPWVHNRCLKLWSDDPSDPYSPSNQRYKVLDGPVSHSMPTRTLGNGNGYIQIDLLGNVVTEGYFILFSDNNICELYNSTSLVSSASKINGKWELQDIGIIDIKISDSQIRPYQPMDQLYLSVLSSSSIFSNIKIE